MEHWTEYSRFFIALLVILDPFAAAPLFLTLTANHNQRERISIAAIAVLTVWLVLTLAAFLGEALLIGMGTSMASFRVGGGIVLMLMAIAMLQGQVGMAYNLAPEKSGAPNLSGIAVVPLAIPIMAGPGAISTVIIQMNRSETPYHGLLVVLVISLSCLLMGLVLRIAIVMGRALSPAVLNITSRLFGLILAAIAVEIIANGLKQLFPVLSS